MISTARFFFDLVPNRITEEILKRDFTGDVGSVDGLECEGPKDERLSVEGCLLNGRALQWAGESEGEYVVVIDLEGLEEQVQNKAAGL